MDDNLLIETRSSLFVSPGALVLSLVLSVTCAILDRPELCAAFACLFFLCLAARLWGQHTLRKVTASCFGEPAALFPPGQVTLTFRIRNNKLLPLLWLEVVQKLEADAPLLPADPEEVAHLTVTDGEGSRQETYLYKKFTFRTGREELLWESPWQACRRGIFHPGQLQLRSGDGFGLMQSQQTLDSQAGVIAIYPALQPVDTALFLRDTWETASGARGYLEDPTVIQSTRGYTPQDSFRRINWRLTARTQETMVNTYETILPKAACFILDGESFNGITPQTEALEDTLSILASLVMSLTEAGLSCSLSLPRSRTMPAQDLAGVSREEILRALAGYQLRPLVQPEDPDLPPYARPSVFRSDRLLTGTAAGRLYYLCSSVDALHSQPLLHRLDPARTLLLPYRDPAPGQATLFSTVPLTSLKRRESP